MIHEQKKLLIGSTEITEIHYQHFLKKAKQINTISKPTWTILKKLNKSQIQNITSLHDSNKPAGPNRIPIKKLRGYF